MTSYAIECAISTVFLLLARGLTLPSRGKVQEYTPYPMGFTYDVIPCMTSYAIECAVWTVFLPLARGLTLPGRGKVPPKYRRRVKNNALDHMTS